jgi:hypothetical protein
MTRRFSVSIPPHWTTQQAEWAHHLVGRIYDAIWDLYESSPLEFEDLRAAHQLELELDDQVSLQAESQNHPL